MIEKYPMLIGGFIWEWVDQTPYKTGEDGKSFLPMAAISAITPTMGFFAAKVSSMPNACPRRIIGKSESISIHQGLCG